MNKRESSFLSFLYVIPWGRADVLYDIDYWAPTRRGDI